MVVSGGAVGFAAIDDRIDLRHHMRSCELFLGIRGSEIRSESILPDKRRGVQDGKISMAIGDQYPFHLRPCLAVLGSTKETEVFSPTVQFDRYPGRDTVLVQQMGEFG